MDGVKRITEPETCEHKERMQLTKPTTKLKQTTKNNFRIIVNPLDYNGNDKGKMLCSEICRLKKLNSALWLEHPASGLKDLGFISSVVG